MSTGEPDTTVKHSTVSFTAGLRPPWRKGESGNPGGKPVAARNKLSAAFIKALSEEFEQCGVAAIKVGFDTEPVKMLQIVASLMPKDVHISARPLEDLTDDELRNALDTIDRFLADPRASALGAGATYQGEPAAVVPALPEAAPVPRGGPDDA